MTNDLQLLLEAVTAIVRPLLKDVMLEVLREQTPEESPRYPEKVSVQQAAEITRYSVNSLYQMHSKGQVPGAIKVGGKLLFDTATLRKWRDNGGHAA